MLNNDALSGTTIPSGIGSFDAITSLDITWDSLHLYVAKYNMPITEIQLWDFGLLNGRL
jgi:hypothetical protein